MQILQLYKCTGGRRIIYIWCISHTMSLSDYRFIFYLMCISMGSVDNETKHRLQCLSISCRSVSKSCTLQTKSSKTNIDKLTKSRLLVGSLLSHQHVEEHFCVLKLWWALVARCSVQLQKPTNKIVETDQKEQDKTTRTETYNHPKKGFK